MRLDHDANQSIARDVTSYHPRHQAVPHSRYNETLSLSYSRLSGYGRGAGEALLAVKEKVKELILKHSIEMSAFDQALLLAIAEHESGFNPDAAARESSAGGIFQIIKSTAEKLELPSDKVFEAEHNIKAGIKLYQENLKIVEQRYGGLQGDNKAAMLYALHHDGPSLKYGGWDIANKFVVPKFNRYFSKISQKR